MKRDIHPNKYQMKVALLDGSFVMIETTNASLNNKTITLDQDYSTHPAWCGPSSDTLSSKKTGPAEKFKDKYQGLEIIS